MDKVRRLHVGTWTVLVEVLLSASLGAVLAGVVNLQPPGAQAAADPRAPSRQW